MSNTWGLKLQCLFVCMFVCLFVCLLVCWIYPPNPTSFDTRVIHGKKRNLSGKVPIEKLTSIPTTRLPLWAKTYTTLISFYHVFLIWRRDGGYLKKCKRFFVFFFVYLTSRASDTLKVQTDYLTFGYLITTSDTPKVQSSEAIAVEEYLLKRYAAIIIV